MATLLIIGTNKGIGLELCRQLQACGDTVIGTCRRPTRALEAIGIQVIPEVDVSNDASVERLADELQGTSLDVLIHNAGIMDIQNLDELDYENVRRHFEVNTLGPLRVITALRGNLHAGSKVAILTSRVGSLGDNQSGGNYGYRISKTAVNMVGVNLAHDFRPDGIPVLLLHPGLVATEMTGGRGNQPEESVRGLIARIDELTMEGSGTFRHANGEMLPW